MAQFVLTITSDSAEEIASFLSPSRTTEVDPGPSPFQKMAEQAKKSDEEHIKAHEEAQAKRKGRPPKNDTA